MSETIVLITGGNRGLGKETARQMATRGATVILGSRDLAAGEAAAREIPDAVAIQLDVGDDASIRSAFAEVESRFGRLDVLINNAGIYPEADQTILTASRALMAGTFETNTLGPLALTQAFVPLLRRSKHPRVVNVSSGYGQIEGLSAGVPSYCISKLALNGVTIMLAEALKPDGIAVNSVCPGWVRTEMGGPQAPRSVEQGASGIVWLAVDASQSESGKFFRDGQALAW
ncbi:MAG: SDR family oxidoreductase [Gemmataceae bacterium]|nr:SDR family oxidoreductase [Gemmataceae bacterium]